MLTQETFPSLTSLNILLEDDTDSFFVTVTDSLDFRNFAQQLESLLITSNEEPKFGGRLELLIKHAHSRKHFFLNTTSVYDYRSMWPAFKASPVSLETLQISFAASDAESLAVRLSSGRELERGALSSLKKLFLPRDVKRWRMIDDEGWVRIVIDKCFEERGVKLQLRKRYEVGEYWKPYCGESQCTPSFSPPQGSR